MAKYPGLTDAQSQYAESFENQGYSRKQAICKAKEVAPTPQQKSARRARQARKERR